MSSEMSTVSVRLVRLHIYFNKLPEDSQGNLAVREVVHPLPSEPDSVFTTVNQILTGQ